MSDISASQPSQAPQQPRVQLGDIARSTLVVMLVVLGFALTIALRHVLVVVFLGLLLATALRPIVGRLRSGNVPRYLAASAAVLLLVASGIGFVLLIAPLVIDQAETLSRQIPAAYDNLRQQLVTSPYLIVRRFAAQLRPATPLPGDGGEEAAIDAVVSQGMVWLPAIGAGLFGLLTTLLFTYYWLLYRERSIRELLLLLPMERREAAESIWLQIEDKIGAFLRGQLILSAATGLLSLLGYWAIGLPYALLMAFAAALLELIPFLGPFITMFITTAIGFSVSPTLGLSALAVGVVIQQAENVFLAPRVMDKAVGISPVVTLLAFVGFAALFGPLGALLAIPLAAVLQVLFREWMARLPGRTIEEPLRGRSMSDRLRYQVRDLAQDLAGYIRAKEADVADGADQAEEDIEDVLAELDRLLENGETPQPAPEMAGERQ